jgi:hypothetical protein
MNLTRACSAVLVFGSVLCVPATAANIYNNLIPNNALAMASRPDTPSFEIESADDFVLGSPTAITSASFVGLIVSGTGGTPSISEIVTEIYRVFPLDSNTARTPNVPTRANSPSDDVFDSRDSAVSGLTFTSTTLATSFTALNSVQPGGIHPSPNQTTGGNGPISGTEVQITVTFTTPISLPANHYFFIPQVALTNGGQFYWLSASRPISGAGTTPFPNGLTDLQAWTRDAALDPDWLRVGTDIVGGAPAPTFNAAFSLDGVTLPEPSPVVLVVGGLVLIALGRWIPRGKNTLR